jgi:hypothetical protein
VLEIFVRKNISVAKDAQFYLMKEREAGRYSNSGLNFTPCSGLGKLAHASKGDIEINNDIPA